MPRYHNELCSTVCSIIRHLHREIETDTYTPPLNNAHIPQLILQVQVSMKVRHGACNSSGARVNESMLLSSSSLDNSWINVLTLCIADLPVCRCHGVCANR